MTESPSQREQPERREIALRASQQHLASQTPGAHRSSNTSKHQRIMRHPRMQDDHLGTLLRLILRPPLRPSTGQVATSEALAGSALSDLYHNNNFFSARKYVEQFSNGVTIVSLYLLPLSGPPADASITQIIKEISLLYVLPSNPLFDAGSKLSVQEAAYATSGWVFSQHLSLSEVQVFLWDEAQWLVRCMAECSADSARVDKVRTGSGAKRHHQPRSPHTVNNSCSVWKRAHPECNTGQANYCYVLHRLDAAAKASPGTDDSMLARVVPAEGPIAHEGAALGGAFGGAFMSDERS